MSSFKTTFTFEGVSFELTHEGGHALEALVVALEDYIGERCFSANWISAREAEIRFIVNGIVRVNDVKTRALPARVYRSNAYKSREVFA